MLHKKYAIFLKEKQEPNIGDTRLIKKFLFFPKNLNNEIRWLETAIILQIYKKCWTAGPEMDPYKTHKWVCVSWVNSPNDLIQKRQIGFEFQKQDQCNTNECIAKTKNADN